MKTLISLAFVVVITFQGAVYAQLADNNGFFVDKTTISPNKRYGILMPTHETGERLKQWANYIVEISTQRKILAIKGVHYFPGINHDGGVKAQWSRDSSILLLCYGGKWEPRMLSIYQFADTKIVKQMDLLAWTKKQIRSFFENIIDNKNYREPILRLNANYDGRRSIFFRGYADSNPKSIPEIKSFGASISGELLIGDEDIAFQNVEIKQLSQRK